MVQILFAVDNQVSGLKCMSASIFTTDPLPNMLMFVVLFLADHGTQLLAIVPIMLGEF